MQTFALGSMHTGPKNTGQRCKNWPKIDILDIETGIKKCFIPLR